MSVWTGGEWRAERDPDMKGARLTCMVWQAWLPLLVRMAETACRIRPVSPQATTRLKRQAQESAVRAWPVGSLGPVLRTVVSSSSWNRDSVAVEEEVVVVVVVEETQEANERDNKGRAKGRWNCSPRVCVYLLDSLYLFLFGCKCTIEE
jgi:hypothetical protein